MSALVPRTDLSLIAHQIRQEWEVTKGAQIDAWHGYLKVGTLLMAARDELAPTLDYGQWLKEQDFGFTRQWAGKLIRLAENGPEVLRLLESALSSGKPTPGVDALLGIMLPRLPAEAQTNGSSPPPLITDPDHHGRAVVNIIIEYRVGPTPRHAGMAHGSGPDKREWSDEWTMGEDATRENSVAFADELRRRFLEKLHERPFEGRR